MTDIPAWALAGALAMQLAGSLWFIIKTLSQEDDK